MGRKHQLKKTRQPAADSSEPIDVPSEAEETPPTPAPIPAPRMPAAPGRAATWLLILAALLFASFLRLYWVQEAHLPAKQPGYQRNGEILPNTHDSYFFGSIIQKAHLGMHSANEEVPGPFMYGPITLLPVKLLDWFNGPVFNELKSAAAEMDRGAAGLKKLAGNSEDNATRTLLRAGASLAEKARDDLGGTHPTPHELRQTALQSAETARQIAQDLGTMGEEATPVGKAFTRAEKLAIAAAKRPMISVEQIMAYMPALLGGLLAVPLVLIGRLLGSTWWGFLAALIGASAHSYFNRTMAGYFDTDMFSVTVPALALYFFLRALCQRSLWPAVAGAATLFVVPFFYRSGIPISLALSAAFIGYQLVFHWREAVAWKSIVPVALAMVFLDSSLGDRLGAGPGLWFLKLAAIIGSAAVLRWIPVFNETGTQPNWPMRAAAGLALAAVLLFSSPLGMVRGKVYQYLPGETQATSAAATATQLQYKNVISTIQEARGIDKRTWAVRISGSVVGFALTVIGYGLLVARHPQCLIAMPFLGIGLFALMGGLRFTIHAVGIAALSATWIFFARESCRLGRTLVAGFLGGLAGVSIWLWLASLTGNHSGIIDFLLLPAGLLAGYAALAAGNEGPGETPTPGQRACIAMGGCATSILTAKAIAAGLSMGKLTGSLGGISFWLELLTVLTAAVIPLSREPRLANMLGDLGARLARNPQLRIHAACLGTATLAGLLLGHIAHKPAEDIYQRYRYELSPGTASPQFAQRMQSLSPLISSQAEAFALLEQQYRKQRGVWREQMLEYRLDANQLGGLLPHLAQNQPAAGVNPNEFIAFLKEAGANAEFKKLLTDSFMAEANENLAAAAGRPLGFEGLILGALAGLAGAWAARGSNLFKAVVVAGSTTVLGLLIMLSMKCGFLGLQLGGVFSGGGFLMTLLSLGCAAAVAGGLSWPAGGVGRIGRATLGAAVAGGLGWYLLGAALGNALLPLLAVLGLWAGWLVARAAPEKQAWTAALFGAFTVPGMVVIGKMMSVSNAAALASSLSTPGLWLWTTAGGLLAAMAAIMSRPGTRQRMTLATTGVAGALTACAIMLLMVVTQKVMASFLPGASGALVLLNNLGLWTMGAAVGLVTWGSAPDRRRSALVWMASGTAMAGALAGVSAFGFKEWAQSPGVVWLLVAGLTAGTLPMALEVNGHFRKLAAGLAAGTGAGLLWVLLAHTTGQPMALALWPVGALAGGAAALTGGDNKGWPAPAVAGGTALLGMAAGITALDWQWANLDLLLKPGALAGLATAVLLPVLCRGRWRAAAAGLLAALAGAWAWTWVAIKLGSPAAILMWPLGGLVGFAVARNGEGFPPNFRPLLAAGLALAAGLVGTWLTPGNDFANGAGTWLVLGVVTAGLAPLVFNEESLPGKTVIAGLAAALLGGLAWGWLAREMNVTGKPGVEPLTFGPWAIGALAGLAVAWAARDRHGWLPPVVATVSALAGVAVGIMVMGTYGSQTPETLGRALGTWSHFNNPTLMLGVVTLLGAATAAGLTLLRERVDGSLLAGWGMAAVGTLGLLVPHALHARQQTRLIEPVLFSPSVDLLEVMGKTSKPGDYMITWWDYGTAGWYHGACNVMIHPGNQTDDIWVAARILSGNSQREAVNLGRVAIEGYSQHGPLAVRHIFKDQLDAQNDANDDGLDDWSNLPAFGEKGAQGVLSTLSLPLPGTGTNQPPGPTYRPPKAERDIFLYLPTRLLPIYPVIRQFSQRDLMPAAKEHELGLLLQPPGSPQANDPATTRDVLRLLKQAAEKGHAGAQLNLAARQQAAYLKALPLPLAHLPDAAREGNATAQAQLVSYFTQQVAQGLVPDIARAHRWAARAVCTLERNARHNHIDTGDTGFAAKNPAAQLKEAHALRDQIARYLPPSLAERHRLEAAQYKPRGAEHAMQLFEPTPVQPFNPGNQPPLLRLRDRYIVDTTDLRFYENTAYYNHARTPGAVNLSASRLTQGMARIREVARALTDPIQKPDVKRLGNQVLRALSEIYPGATLNDDQQQILVRAIGKRDVNTIASFATEAASLHFKNARAWTNTLPATEQARHRNGPQFWAVQTRDGRIFAGEVNKISIDNLLLMDYIPVKPAGNNKNRAFKKQPVNIPWGEVANLYRPVGWLNRIITTFLVKGNRPDGLHQLDSGAVVRGRLAQSRNIGAEPVHHASRLNLVISNEYGTAFLMDRDVFNSNLIQLLLLGSIQRGVDGKELFELIYFNERGRLYRFGR